MRSNLQGISIGGSSEGIGALEGATEPRGASFVGGAAASGSLRMLVDSGSMRHSTPKPDPN